MLREVRSAVRESGLEQARLERGEVPLADDDVDVVGPPVRRVGLDRDAADEDGAVPEAVRDPADDGGYVDATTSSYTFRSASGSSRRPGERASRSST